MSSHPILHHGVRGIQSGLITSFYQPPIALDDADPEIPRLPLLTRPATAAQTTTSAGRAGPGVRMARQPQRESAGFPSRDEQDLKDLMTLIARSLN